MYATADEERANRVNPVANGGFPLSFLQTGMLFHHLENGTSGHDIEQVVVELREPLYISELQGAWEKVIGRHEILRSAFHWKEAAQPMQVPSTACEMPFLEFDWRNLSPDQSDNKFHAFLEEDRRRGLDLSTAPVFRVSVFQHDAAFWRMVWTFHHALLDGRAIRRVLEELFIFYDNSISGGKVSLPEAKSYRAYIDWLHSQDFKSSESFWRELLKGFSTPTPIPVQTPREASNSRGEQELSFSETSTTALRTFAANNEITLNTIIQGAWAVLLQRYSSENDVVFGGVRACRKSTVAGADEMVGLCINTVPVRATVDPEKPLRELLRNLREQWLAMRQHEHTPLVRIQSVSQVPVGTPLFESIVMFENGSLNGWLKSDGKNRQRNFNIIEQPTFALTLNVYGDQQLCFRILYDQSRFHDSIISRMLGHLRTLLESMPTYIDRPVQDVPLMPEEESNAIFNSWRAEKTFPSTTTIHEWFESHVKKSPTTIALICENERLTYADLNERANRLAHHLKELGVGPETLVAICLDRSINLVVGILGILKAGGAYVPIDLAYPQERLAFIVEDARAKVFLSEKKLLEKLPITSAQLLLIDDEKSGNHTSQSPANPHSSAGPKNLAYVIYTSGSTGKPKGVLVTHENVVRLFQATEHWFHCNASDVWTLFHSAAFDFSVWEIWGALLYGGRLVVVPYLVSRSPENYRELLQREKVTVLNQTPSAFKQLMQVDARKPDNLRLRFVIFGGEALDPQSLRPWFEKYGDQQPQLINMYGITETTVHVTYRPLSKSDLRGGSVIGVPIPDLEIYILDQQKHPVPIGVPGEIYVGGGGVARGYLNREELTSQRFIENPFIANNTRDSLRLYRTGDLARFLPGHDIEYLGRIDQQVKIRGFRIELGEIESALREVQGIREAAVVARKNGTDDTRLVAYLIAESRVPEREELRSSLRTTLPDYMLPSAFVFLEQFPLTNNGKLDTKALPAPDISSSTQEFCPPQTETEQRVADIWAEVLGVKKVGLTDNFFELGGHSLLLIRLQQKLRVSLGWETPITTLFQFPTISAFCRFLQKEKAVDGARMRIFNRAQRARESLARCAQTEREVLQ